MITIKVPGYVWNNSLIAYTLDILTSTPNMRYVVFYADRAVITSSLPKHMNGVLSKFDRHELMEMDDWSDIINKIHKEIYDMLVKIIKEMEKEMPVGAE